MKANIPTWTSQNQKEKLAHKIGTLTKLKLELEFVSFLYEFYFCVQKIFALWARI